MGSYEHSLHQVNQKNIKFCSQLSVILRTVWPEIFKDPIFTEGPSSKISRTNFHGWTFQSRSGHPQYPLG